MAEQKDKSQGELTENPMERNEMDFNENAAENGNELDRNTQLKTCTDSSNDSNAPTFRQIKKRSTKGIFISYGNNAGFLERQFVCETVRQLKEINLSEDIWFDKDEVDISSCMWFPQRIEALEKCKAVILFLSQSYFQNKVSLLESKILLKRLQSTERRVHVFPILYNRVEIPKSYSQLLDGALDLSGAQVAKTSVSEKSSIVIGSLSEKIDRYVIKAPVSLVTNQLSERLGKFKGKRLATWSVEDTQEWLLHAGIKEFYRQSFAELMMDGFLMSSLTDEDLSQFLGVDSRGTRRTIRHQIVILQEREKKLPDSWHQQAKSARPRTGTVYLVCDPADTNLAKTLSTELQKNKLLVVYSEYLGQSKEEFLRENGPHMSLAAKVVLVLTEAAAGSPIVYLQVLFSEWLGKAMMTAVFRNSWDRLRPSLKVILGDKSAVDFERQLFQDALPILQDLLRPRRIMPGVILEQAYIDRIAEGVKPLQNLAPSSADVVYWPIDNEEIQPKIFISYQWDVQTKVQEIRTFLELNSLFCWADLCIRGHSSMSTRSVAADPTTETLKNKIHRHMKAAAVVLSCFTPKYIHSDNCNTDLQLAMSLNKPLVPVLLHFMPWPPEGTTSSIRRFLCQFATIDLSNDKLFKRNLHLLLNRIKKSLKIKEL